MRNQFLLSALLLAGLSGLAGPLGQATAYAHEAEEVVADEKTQPPQPHAPAEAYQPAEVHGWTLRVHEALIADEQLHEQAIAEISHQLFRIKRMLAEDKVQKMQEVVIWVELRNPISGTVQYHPSRQWLAGNGYLPEKAKGVDIGDARSFLNTTRTTQPFVVLHELAHAYHDQVLGFNHEKVNAAYEAAVASGKYEQVLHINGRTVRHYALTNAKEYFSELTECYLGTNDFYPFVRSELQQHDPQGYELMREVWGPIR